MTREALIFDVEQLRLGIWSDNVKQVLLAVAETRITSVSAMIEGVINVHGRIVPVLDLRRMLNLPSKSIQASDHIVVVQLPDHEIAIRVDRAIDLTPIGDDDIQPIDAKHSAFMIAKTNRGLIQLLEPSRLLSDDDATRLDAILAAPSRKDT